MLGSVDHIRIGAGDQNGVAPPPHLHGEHDDSPGIGGALPVIHLPVNPFSPAPDLDAHVLTIVALTTRVQCPSEVNYDIKPLPKRDVYQRSQLASLSD